MMHKPIKEWCEHIDHPTSHKYRLGRQNYCDKCDMERMDAEIEKLQEALRQCVEWSEAYPVDIFPQPTPEQVDAVCKTLGFRLDSISAMVLRNYTGRIGEIAREALSR